MAEQTKYDKVMKWGKNNPFVIVIIILSSLAGVIVTFSGAYNTITGNNEVNVAGVNYNKDEVKTRIFATLKSYSNDVNNRKFDAYKYFTNKIERFYKMYDTSPKKINEYVNGAFYKEFQNPTMYFDEKTLSVAEKGNGEYEAIVIMYSTYYKVSERKQYNDFRTKTVLGFDNDFRIKYFRQFYD